MLTWQNQTNVAFFAKLRAGWEGSTLLSTSLAMGSPGTGTGQQLQQPGPRKLACSSQPDSHSLSGTGPAEPGRPPLGLHAPPRAESLGLRETSHPQGVSCQKGWTLSGTSKWTNKLHPALRNIPYGQLAKALALLASSVQFLGHISHPMGFRWLHLGLIAR